VIGAAQDAARRAPPGPSVTNSAGSFAALTVRDRALATGTVVLVPGHPLTGLAR
jgi:hypothetical protein